MARILVVDGDAAGAEEVCRYLRKSGHDVVRTLNGQEALSRLAVLSPDIVVLDVLGNDGMQFLQVLRNYYRGRFIPVILLTALGNGQHIRSATHMGVKRIFLKSNYELPDLLACVNELVSPVPGADLSAISARASLNG